ncbi:MAG: stage V sporulation protein AC [Clostridia bacterium]|nr:stage V sporulation protein AC [Clostridia bacterium]
MRMTNKEYADMVKRMAPKSKTLRNCFNAFWIGGLICCLGQALMNGYAALGMNKTDSGTVTSITLVFLSALLTGLAVYDNIAKLAGAGTLVPITGFANSISAPAIEYQTEGFITGLAVKMFTIAGPVLVYGTSASILYGFIYWLITK